MPLKEFLEEQCEKVEVLARIHQCAVHLECRCVICVEEVVDQLGWGRRGLSTLCMSLPQGSHADLWVEVPRYYCILLNLLMYYYTCTGGLGVLEAGCCVADYSGEPVKVLS